MVQAEQIRFRLHLPKKARRMSLDQSTRVRVVIVVPVYVPGDMRAGTVD